MDWRQARGRAAAVIVTTVCALAGPSSVAAAGSLRQTGGGLQVVTEPQAGVTPFVKLISGAHKSIDLVDYELKDPTIEAALVSAARRGVDVRVLLDSEYYGRADNAAAYEDLAAHHVHVEWAPTYNAITHQKTLTIDNKIAVVMTLNFDGLYSSTRDFGIVDRQPQDVAAITQTFDADWSHEEIKPSTGTGDLLWSPDAGDTFLDAIKTATTSIDVENEEMDDSDVADALCAAAKDSVKVKIVMTYDSEWSDALKQLERCGASVVLYHGQTYYIHAKILLVDGRRAIVGSQNFSGESLWYNRELSIDTTDTAVVDSLTAAFNQDYNNGPGGSRRPGR